MHTQFIKNNTSINIVEAVSYDGSRYFVLSYLETLQMH